MIAKTPSGLDFFDDTHGGIYRGRSWMLFGRSGTGKTIASLQFCHQGLRLNERCLLLAALPAADLTIYAEGMGFPVGKDIEHGNLILLEYSDFVPGRDREDNITLPPDGFEQLKEIIAVNAVQRVVLDTVLPWVCIRQPERLSEHVFSFVRAFERIGTTSLFTLPKPVSPLAFRLKNALEEVVPISVQLSSSEKVGHHQLFRVSKYLGEKMVGHEIEYAIEKGHGLIPVSKISPQAGSPEARSFVPGPPPVPAVAPAEPTAAGPSPSSAAAPSNIRLSSLLKHAAPIEKP